MFLWAYRKCERLKGGKPPIDQDVTKMWGPAVFGRGGGKYSGVEGRP